MELERLYAFRAVAELENISRAAKQLHISQPALSQTIHRLEEEWGCPLFEREGRRIRLNHAGKILLTAIRQIDAALENARLSLAEENGRPPVISLYIGCASMLLPELLRCLKAQTPEVRYQIRQWSGEPPSQEADLLITASPGAPDETTELLMQEPIGVALPVGHPLLQKEKIFLHDLAGEEMISLNPSWSLYGVTARAMEQSAFTPNITIWVDNPNLLRDFLRMGIGLAFAPLVSWRAFASKEVALRPLFGCKMQRNIYLVHHFGDSPPRSVAACIDGIRSFFRQQAAKAE